MIIKPASLFGPVNVVISKIANEMIGPWAKISSGTLYPLLARLEQVGLIFTLPQEASGSRRQSHRYAITPAGRRRFHILMMDTSSNLGDYPLIFHLKVVHLEFPSPRERLHLVNHYINYCERTILHMQSEAQEMQRMQSGCKIRSGKPVTILRLLTPWWIYFSISHNKSKRSWIGLAGCGSGFLQRWMWKPGRKR